MQDGETAIFFAARSGHTNVVKILVENGAEVDHRNKVTIIIYYLQALSYNVYVHDHKLSSCELNSAACNRDACLHV